MKGHSTYKTIFKALRKELGLTQSAMVRKLNVSQSWLSKVETGKISNPGANEFIHLMSLHRALEK